MHVVGEGVELVAHALQPLAITGAGVQIAGSLPKV